MNRFFNRLILASGLIISGFMYSYGVTGHRIVAEIAERNLTRKAKKNLKKIIGDQKLAYWANWPDFIKADTTGTWKHSEVWHYVNVNSHPNAKMFSDSLQAQKGPNLYTEIKALSTKIKDKSTPQSEREIALRFLIHMVGDSSQPLHVGRAEDLGGNTIKIKFFGDNTNLHSLWDSKLIDFQKYSYEEYATVLNVKSKKEIEQIQSGTLEDWFYDSQKMADTIYANTVAGAAYSYDYNYKFAQTMERQLLHGGLRLAKILNEIL